MKTMIVVLVLLMLQTNATFFNQLGGGGGLLNSFGTFDRKSQLIPTPIFPAFPNPSFPALNFPFPNSRNLPELFPKQTTLQRQKPDLVNQEDLPVFAKIVREIDGSKNNRKNINLGKAKSKMPRLTSAAYADGKAEMVRRRNPRELSNAIGSFAQGEEVQLNEYGLNMLFVLFGQFIDHDLDLVLPSGTEKALIEVPRGDPSFDPKGEGNKNIEFSRSKFTLKNGQRVFANELTSYVDGSQVYGSDLQTMKKLREFRGGRLKLDKNMLPKDEKGAFIAGDIRVNENIGLTSIQTIFAREHNRQCELYLLKHPGLSDEAVFQMARNKIIGFIQKITFQEYLPLLLGQEAFQRLIGDYKGYDETIDATINLEFATAAYRIGHPLLADGINFYDYFNKKGKFVSMKDMFESFRSLKTSEEVDFIMNGMMRTQCKQRNHQLVDGLRNLLVEFPGIIQDLFSLNVQRGRDHGIPDYNTVRRLLGFKEIRSFEEISTNKETVYRLTKAIPNPNQLDLWIGIISQESLPGGNLGEVGAAIVGETFRRVRNGDRFWYESIYPREQVQQIQQTAFRDIIVRNTKLSRIREGFTVPDSDAQEKLFEVNPSSNFFDKKSKLLEIVTSGIDNIIVPPSTQPQNQKSFEFLRNPHPF